MSLQGSQPGRHLPSGAATAEQEEVLSNAEADKNTDVFEGLSEQTPLSHAYLVRILLGEMTANWHHDNLDPEFSKATRTIQEVADQWMTDKLALRTAPEPSNSIKYLRRWQPSESHFSKERLQQELHTKSTLLSAIWFCLTGDPSPLDEA